MPKQQPKMPFILEGEVAYTDTTQKKLGTLPRGSRIIQVTVHTEATATSATLDLGTLANDDLWIAAMDVSGAGSSQGTVLSDDKSTTKVDVYALIEGGPVVGAFTIDIMFTTDRSRGPK